MNPRILMSWFIMILYGAPVLALIGLDAFQGFPRTRQQPTATLTILAIGVGVVGIGILMIRGENKEDRRYKTLPRCRECNVKMEPSVNRDGRCVFCVATDTVSGTAEDEPIATVAYIARHAYEIRPVNSRFGIANPAITVKIYPKGEAK